MDATLSNRPTSHLFGCAATARTKEMDATLCGVPACHLFGRGTLTSLKFVASLVFERTSSTRSNSTCTPSATKYGLDL